MIPGSSWHCRSENVADKLRNREILGHRPPGTQWNQTRRFYWCARPTATVVNVEKPEGFLRKFSADGSVLVAFGADQRCLHIYEYRGAAVAGQLLATPSSVALCDDGELGSTQIRRNLFRTLFRHRATVRLIDRESSAQLNRECSLFTLDGRHLIVAASAPSQAVGDRFPALFEFYQNNESLDAAARAPPDDVTVFSVDFREGRVCSEQFFKCDKIVLAHNQGLCLIGRLLAVLSVQHQTIHLFRMDEETGVLLAVQQIGRRLFDDDDLLTRHSAADDVTGGAAQFASARRFAPMAESVLTGFKQRFLTSLFRQAQSSGATAVRRFFGAFDYLRWLRLWRAQWLDERTLLLRLAPEQVVSLRADAAAHPSWFVVYDWRAAAVIDIFDAYSQRLLRFFDSHPAAFACPEGHPRFASASWSCGEAECADERLRRSLHVCARRGGGGVSPAASQTETTRRLLAQLPLCAQSFSASPLLDLALFSYDEQLVSALERPKPAGDCSVRFYSRESKQLSFRLLCGLRRDDGGGASTSLDRPLVAFIFHPTDPFVISVQKGRRGDYIVNFHLPAAVGLST